MTGDDKIKAREEAAKDLKARATEIRRQAGGRVGRAKQLGKLPAQTPRGKRRA